MSWSGVERAAPSQQEPQEDEEAAGAPGALESHAGFSTPQAHTPGSHACRQVVT